MEEPACLGATAPLKYSTSLFAFFLWERESVTLGATRISVASLSRSPDAVSYTHLTLPTIYPV
mgnify:CR=1 FL=1